VKEFIVIRKVLAIQKNKKNNNNRRKKVTKTN